MKTTKMVTDKHLYSILQLFVLVIRQWSKDHPHLTPANGHPKDHKDYRVSIYELPSERYDFQNLKNHF